jgi:homocysteine S-methyltransferase
MVAGADTVPLLIMPNAGLPSRVEGQFVYAAGPAYFAEAVPRFLAAGARLVGGCCGTTPDHVAAMRQALDKELARVRGTEAATAGGPVRLEAGASPRSTIVERSGTVTPHEPPPPTGLATKLGEGRFVISVEIDPPRSVRIERTIEAARLLQDAGVDLVNISDSAMARVRMGAMAVAFGIQHDLDLECLVHLTTRDRNLMALESELLGAHALGVRDILALTGDPPRVGDYPTGTGIWDIDSTGLIGVIQRLNRGEDQAGRPIGAPAGFTVACAVDPTAGDLEHELDRLTGKLEAGADLIMTQPIYAREQWDRFMERASRRWGDRLPRPVLLGVLPLHSSRHAEFLHNEVPGITIPDRVRAAMASAGDRGAEVGLEQAGELLEGMRPLVSGTYVMPSFGRYEQSAELVRRLRASEPVLLDAAADGHVMASDIPMA